MTSHDRLEEIVSRGDPVEWLRVLKHEATRANNAEASRTYLMSEINRMRRVMQDAGTWDDFCRMYADRYGALARVPDIEG